MSKLQQMMNDRLYGMVNVTRYLKNEYKVKVIGHPKYSELVQFHYDQLESPRDVPVVNECRGCIVSMETGKFIARPFDRFFNADEPQAAPIDWNTAKVFDKLDGSLMIAYCYKGEWMVATKQSPTASGNMGTSNITFSDMFWNLLDDKFLSKAFGSGDHEGLTFLFEMMCPENRVVVNHTEPKLALLEVRHNESGEYLLQDWFPDREELWGVPVVRSWDLSSLDAVKAAAMELNPMEGEGYVVVDKDHNRIKIKSPKYVQIHHLKDGFGTRRILELIKLGETNEVLAYFDEYRVQFNQIESKINEIVSELESIYDEVEDIETDKEFALTIQEKTNLCAPLFAKRKRGSDIRDEVLKLNVKVLEKLVL